MSLSARDYQVRFRSGFIDAIRRGKRRIVAVAPTGSGKTFMASDLACSHVAKGGTVAFVVHRRELVAQSHRTLERLGLSVGSRGLNASAPVQVETVQSILSKGSAPPGTFAILDECHHLVAEQWSAIPKVYEKSIVLGLTATPERADGKPLGDFFEEMIVVAQIRDLIPTGDLVPCEVFAPKVARTGKKMELSPVDAYLKYAPGTSAVVFAPHVSAASDFAASFIGRGIDAKVLTGNTRAEFRDQWLFDFERGVLKVLVNVYVLTEGWDAPIAETCILARKVGHAGSYLQMVGRVLRPHAGKASAKLLDLWGTNVETHGPPDADRVFSLHGRAIATRDGPGFCKVHGLPVPCQECDRIPAELRTPGDAGGELDKWAAKRNADDTPKRVKQLASFIRKGRDLGWKPGAAAIRFKAIYRHWPAKDLTAAAEAYLAGEFAIGERDAE